MLPYFLPNTLYFVKSGAACVLDLIMNDLMNELRFHQISSEYVFRHTLSCLSKDSHESLE